MDKPQSYYAFQILYWRGVREGELLAPPPADFDFAKSNLIISKSQINRILIQLRKKLE